MMRIKRTTGQRTGGQFLRELWRQEDGATVALIAVSMVALLGVAALAVDVGVMMNARTEAQRVADLSALAGAGILATQPNNATLAEQEAINFAARNNVIGLAATVQAQDVDVDIPNSLVRVRVYRSSGRGNPVSTVFARVLGIDDVDVGAVGAAQVFGAGGATCLLPVALPDRWFNAGSAAWDPAGEGDYYVPPDQPGYSGYTDADIGTQLVIKPSEGGPNQGQSLSLVGKFEPGWYYMWIPDAGSGASGVRPHIVGCPDNTIVHTQGEMVTDKNGNMQAVVRDFQDLIDQDPNASWDSSCNCVTGGQGMASPRIRGIPLFDPTTYSFDGSNSNFEIASFVGVFIEYISPGPQGQKLVYARIMSFSGTDPTAGNNNGLAKTVRLVE
jgi:hypothetical protein